MIENKLYTLSDLEGKVEDIRSSVNEIKSDMDTKAKRIKDLKELLRYCEMYAECKPIHEKLLTIKFKSAKAKYREEHESELTKYQVAVRRIKEITGIDDKIQYKPKTWKTELDKLNGEYATQSAKYKPLHDELLKLLQVKHNVDTVLRSKEQVENRETEMKKSNMEL